MKAGRSWAAVAILLLFVPGMAQSASENHRQSLRGLTGVTVRLESADAAARQAGVTVQAISKIVADKLAQAGIKVSASRTDPAPGNAVLYVCVRTSLIAAASAYVPVYTAKVTVALLQDAVAARDATLNLGEAKTWDAGFVTAYSRADLPKANNVVGDLVDEFVNDWRAVNPNR